METLIQAGLSNALSATVLAILVFSLGRLLRDRPAVRHALWLLVLIKLVTPPLYSVPVSWLMLPSEPAPAVVIVRGMERSTAAETSVASARLGDEPSFDLAQFDGLESAWEATATWLKPFVVDSPLATMGRIWLMGTLLVLGLSVYRIAGFRRVVQAAEPVTDDVEGLVDELASRIGLAHSPSTRWIVGKFSPMVWALPGSRPRLLIPLELWKTLDHAQRSSLIAHELAHLRRGDHHVRLFEIVVTALYWWHPLVWQVRRGLRNAEEQCCDAWVVWTFPDFARSYAETLLETLDFLHPSDFAEPLLSSGLGKVDHLRKRLTMIMTGTSSRGLGAGGLFGLAAVASLLLPIHPTWAGKAEDEKQIVVITGEGKQESSPREELRTVTITSGDSRATELYTTLIGTQGDAENGGPGSKPKASNIVLKIMTGDTVREIRTDSIDEAIKILEEQKTVLGKTISDKNVIGVVDGIESAIKNLKQAKSLQGTTGTKLKAEKHEQEKKTAEKQDAMKTKTFTFSGSSGPASAEAQAKLAKARERFKVIAGELESKQREFQKAIRELDSLNPGNQIFEFGTVENSDFKTIRRLEPEAAIKYKLGELKNLGVVKDHRIAIVTQADNQKTEQHRIAELEAKLQKLADEVKSLKKDR